MGQLREEDFEIALEESITKLRWDKMGDDQKEHNEDPAMKAISEVLSEEENEEIRRHEMVVEGMRSMVYIEGGNKEAGNWQCFKKKE